MNKEQKKEKKRKRSLPICVNIYISTNTLEENACVITNIQKFKHVRNKLVNLSIKFNLVVNMIMISLFRYADRCTYKCVI